MTKKRKVILPTNLPNVRRKKTPSAAATQVKVSTEITSSREWLPWGVDDRLPTVWREKVENTAIAGGVLVRKAEMMYGDGIVYAIHSDTSTKPEIAYVQEIEDFLRRNNVQEWFMSQAMDYCLHTNVFGELEVENTSDGVGKVIGIYHKVAEFCRLSQLHETAYRSYYLHYSTDFWTGDKPNSGRLAKLPLLQWDLPMSDSKNRVSKRRLAYHNCLMSPGTIFYGRAPWMALFREGGWLDVAADVPGLVYNQQRKNLAQTTAIEVPDSYLQMRSGKMALTPEELKDAFEGYSDDIEAKLADKDLKGSPIIYVVNEDPGTGVKRGALEFKTVGTRADKDVWMPSVGQANAEICVGWGVDPNQLGVSPDGGTIGAGSGSGQREGYNIGITTNNPHQKALLRVLDFISDWNGWGVKFYVAHSRHTTKDKQESGVETAAVK